MKTIAADSQFLAGRRPKYFGKTIINVKGNDNRIQQKNRGRRRQGNLDMIQKISADFAAVKSPPSIDSHLLEVSEF